MGPFLVAYVARVLSKRGHRDANITAGMLGGLITIPTVLIIQIAPSPFWAFVFYAPALAAVNSPFGIAAGALPVITPPHLRARVAAVYMLMGAVGMMFGPPLAGAFNEYIFPGVEGLFNDHYDMFLWNNWCSAFAARKKALCVDNYRELGKKFGARINLVQILLNQYSFLAKT